MPLVMALAAGVGVPPAGEGEALSLATALAQANTRNPELRALRERARAFTSRGESIRKQTLPRLGLEVNAQRTDNPAAVFAHRLNAGQFAPDDFQVARLNAPEPISHLGSSLYLDLPIDLFGRVSLAAQAQAASRDAFNAHLREAEAAIALQVTEAYLGAVLARQGALATERAVAAARSREASTRARFSEGVALESDILRVRARRRAREADFAAQQAEAEVAEATLARLIGAPEGMRFDLTDAATPSSTIEPLEAWKARAESTRPTVVAAHRQREAAALTVRFEREASRPEVTAQARLMDERTAQGGNQSWAIGAQLRWSAFDPARGTRVAAAAAEERAAVEEEQAARDLVRFEVEAAFIRLDAARDRLAAAQGGAEEGREALRVVQERRAQGLATLTDELETEAEAFAAELEEIHASRGVLLAEAVLKRAAGVNLGSNLQ